MVYLASERASEGRRELEMDRASRRRMSVAGSQTANERTSERVSERCRKRIGSWRGEWLRWNFRPIRKGGDYTMRPD